MKILERKKEKKKRNKKIVPIICTKLPDRSVHSFFDEEMIEENVFIRIWAYPTLLINFGCDV